MRRPILIFLLVSLLSTMSPAAEAVQLKIATVAPDGSFWMTEARKAADEVSERTYGRVSFRFYPGGTMGDDGAVQRKMRIGQLHGGVFVAGSFSHAVPDLQIYTLPLLFSTYDEVDAVRAKMDARLIEALAEQGFHSFGFIEGGFAYIYSTKKAATFAELEGQKAWLPENDPIGKVLIEEARLSPVPLSLADVLTGLQTGLVDVVTGPPVAAVALQWFTKVKYAIEYPVVYTYGTMVLSNKAWDRLSADDQKIVDEVLTAMTHTLDRRAREDNKGARRALEAQGVETLTPPADTQRQWQELAKRSSARLAKELGLSRSMLDAIEAEIAALGAGSTESR
ncbi:MAG: TRAP transporter substrate-binding protein DctP [Candidatus Sulfomarinibacteraceae bacterium]